MSQILIGIFWSDYPLIISFMTFISWKGILYAMKISMAPMWLCEMQFLRGSYPWTQPQTLHLFSIFIMATMKSLNLDGNFFGCLILLLNVHSLGIYKLMGTYVDIYIYIYEIILSSFTSGFWISLSTLITLMTFKRAS